MNNKLKISKKIKEFYSPHMHVIKQNYHKKLFANKIGKTVPYVATFTMYCIRG